MRVLQFATMQQSLRVLMASASPWGGSATTKMTAETVATKPISTAPTTAVLWMSSSAAGGAFSRVSSVTAISTAPFHFSPLMKCVTVREIYSLIFEPSVVF